MNINVYIITQGAKLTPPFKNLQKIPCVYKINFKGDYFYIGSTVNIEKRINKHLSLLSRGKGSKKIIGTMTNVEILSVDILHVIEDKVLLRRAEYEEIEKNLGSRFLLNTAHYEPNEQTIDLNQILLLLSNGDTSKEIGAKIRLSSRTVEKHLENLRASYGAINASHLISIALRTGIIQ